MSFLQLQGIGSVPAKQAGEIKIGDTLIWNYGYKSMVKNVTETKTKKSIIVTILEDDGNIYERRMTKTRLVGIAM